MDPDLVMYQTIKEHKVVSSITEHGNSEVQSFYNGATVFVTGGTGFLGKQLIEKLFRASNVFKVYLLIRGKKGKTIQERLEDMLKDPVFDLLREKQPHFAEKIKPLEGDVSCLRLGLSQNDWNTLINQLEVIFHVAATTKFDEGLRVATQVNVKGTREALALGKECKILKSFVHVSTAFVNATDESAGHRILEQFYPCPMPPEVMIQIAETLDDQLMSNIEANLIKGYPNTYTFTKSLAEELVRGCEGVLPICVVRPAIVIASYKEPIPGWVDMSCAYGASGLILGPATGLVHVLYGDANTRFGLVPVDYVNNAILVAGFDVAYTKNKDIKIYTISGARNLFLWANVVSHIQRIGAKFPPPSAVWYIFTTSTANRIVYWILTCILHYIPGFILDAGYVVFRKPAMFTKLYKKVYKSQLSLSYFTSNTWIFDDSNSDRLYKSLTKIDQAIFDFDTTHINQKNYLTLWCIGIREYLMKDGLKNTEYARKKQCCLRLLHYVTSFLYIYCLWYVFSSIIFFLISFF